MLYYDDLELCNPLGKSAGTHKIGVFYYVIANLPPIYQSRLASIRLVAVVSRIIIDLYGIDIVLNHLTKDLCKLAQGTNVNINGVQHQIRGALISVNGDTPAANYIGGFKIGVGFAFQKCRTCECTFNDMQNKFSEKEFIQRTQERYDAQCKEMDMAQCNKMRDRLSIAYGINRRSAARDIPHFDVTRMIPEDIMHIIFEGVAVYEVKEALSKILTEGSFSLEQFNEHIENIEFGCKDKGCQPIPHSAFYSTEPSLKQSASGMIALLCFLPFILLIKLHCNSIYAHFISDLCEIVLLILSPIISLQTVEVLRALITSHLKLFKELFPEKNIIPKQHYMVHIPSAILKYGPLSNVWCMRFEGKHQFIKQLMSGSHNFKNVEKSISHHNAMYECSLNVCDIHPLFNNDFQVGPVCKVNNLEYVKNMIFEEFGTDKELIHSAYCTSWIINKGQKFITDKCEVLFGEINNMPEFGRLSAIWVVSIGTNNENCNEQIYFRLQMYETVGYHEDSKVYEVVEPVIAGGLQVVYIENLVINMALHVYKGQQNKMFIPLPYDIIDTIRLHK
ncbi:hypothetical protein AOXY_G21364 [Acipenser oxyrinchus oxyrinchus]|uniref:Uncharacterized protein n=1 Tax=Acipenser oxyrinchus oxyrinchus TaxID=40147 RepID=A0AAD8CXP4_ACIOX|nr:hypothetical protein AOXY_G21364 [Acipenser oxyrinchus oxyrinchus]